MKLSFEPMTQVYAQELVSWQYEKPYDIYGYPESERKEAITYLTDKRNQFFAVVSKNRLIGFRSFGKDGRVQGGTYDDSYLDTGGGLKPDLTGKGMGAEIIQKGLTFGSVLFSTERFRVTIAAFNQRALKVCQRLGFEKDHRFQRLNDDTEFIVLTLDKLTNRN